MNLPPTTLLLMGIQGSGKGTQASLLSEKYGYVLLSMGDLLRAEREKDTERGRFIKKTIDAGVLVPDDVSTPLILDVIRKLPADQRLIIDGHPRTLPQTDMLLNGLAEIGRTDISALIINLSEEEGLKRLLDRGRVDDTEEGIRKRFAWSRDQLMPVVERFRNEKRLVEVDGHESIEEVQGRVVKALRLP